MKFKKFKSKEDLENNINEGDLLKCNERFFNTIEIILKKIYSNDGKFKYFKCFTIASSNGLFLNQFYIISEHSLYNNFHLYEKIIY